MTATIQESTDEVLSRIAEVTGDSVPEVSPTAARRRQDNQEYTPAVIPAAASRLMPWADLVTGSADPGETLTSAELLAKAGLDWGVGIRPLFRRMNDGTYRQHPRARETYKLTDESPLGEVKSHYEPFSNPEVFAFGDHISQSGQGRWVDAGQQGNGYRVFMTMLLREFAILDGDMYRLYAFFRASHDGSTGLNAWIVPFRVECTNQQQLVDAHHQGHVKIQHTSNISGRVAEAKASLAEAADYSVAFTQMAEKLARTTVSDQKVRAVLQKIIKEGRARRDEMIADIRHVYNTSPTVDPYKGTAYGLLNAITEYFDHVKPQKSGNARFESIMLGEGAKARSKALLALAA
jgi:phage/plasmid-like protein (TIGR03299 family)